MVTYASLSAAVADEIRPHSERQRSLRPDTIDASIIQFALIELERNCMPIYREGQIIYFDDIYHIFRTTSFLVAVLKQDVLCSV